MDAKESKVDRKQKAGSPQTVAGFLATALKMEDQISRSVYEDYLNRRNWPRQIDDTTFHEIEKRLTTLIQDTKRHREITLALIARYGRDTKPE